MPATLRVMHSWDCPYPGATLEGWRVYASTAAGAKGVVVAEVGPEERHAAWECAEGLYYVRVLAVSKGGLEQSWRGVDPASLYATGRDGTIGTPDDVAVGHVESSLMGRVAMEAPARHDEPYYVQVIEGADAETGKLIQEVAVMPRGPLAPDASRQVSATFPMEGLGATKSLVVRAVGMSGRPGGAVTRTVREPSSLARYHVLDVASWTGTTLDGFAAAGATDAWEYDATDGLRLRAIPAASGLTSGASGWGTGAAGLFATMGAIGPYLHRATIESDEIDLGSVLTFRLTIEDELQRKSGTGALSKPSHWYKLPACPAARDEVRREPNGNAWLMRETIATGAPRQPIRGYRWEYVIADAPAVPHGDGDYVPYMPGQFVSGQYVRVRLVIDEPTAMYQVICPSATITALVERRTVATVEAKTGTYTLLETDAEILVTNEGATSKPTYTLPAARGGLGPYVVVVQDADGLRVQAGTGDTIRVGASVSAGGGYAEATLIGSTLTLVAVNATEWFALSSTGTWTLV